MVHGVDKIIQAVNSAQMNNAQVADLRIMLRATKPLDDQNNDQILIHQLRMRYYASASNY